MLLLSLDSIKIPPDRQRTYIDSIRISEFAKDIATNGLIHAITIREEDKQLIAGERRFRAIQYLAKKQIPFYYGGKLIPPNCIPAVTIAEADPDTCYAIELAENIQREDLSWQEKALATARLHDILLTRNAAQTIRDTASEIKQAIAQGAEITAISEDLLLAKHLNDPKIQNVANKKDAVKAVKLKMHKEYLTHMAQLLTPLQQRHKLLEGDAKALLVSLPDNSVDLILTDPPYGIKAHVFGTMAAITHHYDDSFPVWLALMRVLAAETMRITKPQAHAYIFCDFSNFIALREIMLDAGWSVWRTPFIWVKGNHGLAPELEYGPRRSYECILFANKGKKKTLELRSDVLIHTAVQVKEHSAAKPVELYIDLIRRSALPGNIILDPFAGSGTIFNAAEKTHCLAIGMELEASSIGLCKLQLERLNATE